MTDMTCIRKLDPDIYLRIKTLATSQERTVADVINEALLIYLKANRMA